MLGHYIRYNAFQAEKIAIHCFSVLQSTYTEKG